MESEDYAERGWLREDTAVLEDKCGPLENNPENAEKNAKDEARQEEADRG